VNTLARAEEHDPLGLGLMLLREDPQFSRIPESRRVPLVEAALADGCSVAARIARLWGNDPAAIAARRRIPVVDSQADGGYGSVVVYATYTSQPSCITLFRPAISRLSAFARGRGSERLTELSKNAASMNEPVLASMFIAHELYHHFDCLRGKARLSQRHTVRIFSVGRWQWTSGLSSLSEIAAGAFAQRLMGLPFHPASLDVLFKRIVMNHGEHGEKQTRDVNSRPIGNVANICDMSSDARDSM
jgi:hypothetical protein